MKTRPIATKGFYERAFITHFFDIYKDDNYMTYYNFCQQYEDYFAIAKAKRPNCITFAAFFL